MRTSAGHGRFRPRLTPGVAWIAGLELGVFLLYLFSGDHARSTILGWFALTPDSLSAGHVWKLASTILINVRGWTLFFDLLMLWLFVPVFERAWGTSRFVRFFVVTSLVGNAVSAGVGLALGSSQPIVGISPFIYASLAAYGVMYANQPVQLYGVIPIRGRTLAIGVAVFLLLFTLLGRAWVDAAGFFAAMLVGCALAVGIWQPNVWWLKFRRWNLRRRYRVIDGGEKSGLRGENKKKSWLN